MEDVEEILTGFQPWISARQHVVSNETLTIENLSYKCDQEFIIYTRFLYIL